MSTRLVLFGFALLLTVATAPTTLAQSVVPPDVVELTNGGMVRGTIIEHIPGDHVTLQLATGELRTFPADQVRTVRSDAAVSPQTPLPRPEPRDTVRVQFRARDGAPLTAHRLAATGSAVVGVGRHVGVVSIDQFETLCTAPCEVELPRGTYDFGVSEGSGQARRADHAHLALLTDSTLDLEYESREGVRTGGWVVFVASLLGGMGLMLGGLGSDGFISFAITGSVIAGVGMLIAVPMFSLNDHADVQHAVLRF